MSRRFIAFILVCVLILPLLSACAQTVPSGGNHSAGTNPQNGKNEPVKLLVYSVFANYPTDDDFRKLFAEPVKQKYPHIDLELKRKGKDDTLESVLMSNPQPDLVIDSFVNMTGTKQAGVFTDLNPFVKKYNFDLKRIDPNVIELIKNYSNDGELYAIPFFMNFTVLWYNRDIFDKFGVPYPKDDSLWSDIVDLARKVTKVEGGVQYRGLDAGGITQLAWPLGVGYVDRKTSAPMIEQWKPAYEMLQTVISIPGNFPAGSKWRDLDAFIKSKTVAMLNEGNIIQSLVDSGWNGWDLVTTPQYPDHRGTSGAQGGRALIINRTSAHKDDAFRVIETVLTDAVQTELVKSGQLSPLIDRKLLSSFGVNIPALQGKNIEAIFKLPTGYRPISDYDGDVSAIVLKRADDLVAGKDINTVIRETKEEMEQVIRSKSR
jgi:multiple sugar transport system substrate-binding protein